MKILIAGLALALTALASGVAGTWNITAPRKDGSQIQAKLIIRASGNSYSGIISAGEGDEVALRDVRVNESELKFSIPTDQAEYQVTATVDGDTMKGTFTVDKNPGGTFTGTRAGAVKPDGTR